MSLLLWTFAGSLLPFFPPVAFSCIHDLPPPMSYAVVFSFYLFQYIPCFINALRIYLVLFHNIGLRVFFISSMGKQSSTSSSCGLYPSTWSAACVVCASKLSRQVTSLSMTQGPFNLLTDCCTNYHNNFSVLGGVCTYYSDIPKYIQVGEHQCVENTVINMWVTMMLVGW